MRAPHMRKETGVNAGSSLCFGTYPPGKGMSGQGPGHSNTSHWTDCQASTFAQPVAADLVGKPCGIAAPKE